MRNSSKAFTLTELIMIMLIVAILATVAFSRMAGMAPIRLDMAARKIQSDIRYAQSLAISTQKWTGIYFNATTDIYAVYIDDSGTSPANWALATDPLTKENFTVQLNSGEFRGIDITIVFFNAADRALVFDKWGNPYSYTGAGAPTALANPAGVRLVASSGTKDVRVERGTGRVYITAP